MRRTSLALLSLTLAAVVVLVPSFTSTLDAQTPQVVADARQMMADGQTDAAINALRQAMITNPADAAIRQALVDALDQKRAQLRSQLTALGNEIASLAMAGQGTDTCGGQTPIEVGGAIAAPKRTHNVNAEYSLDALKNRVEGTVVMEIVVGCQGEVASARLVKGVPMFNDAALDAVKQWRYTPTLLNGKPVPVRFHVTVTFTLR